MMAGNHAFPAIDSICLNFMKQTLFLKAVIIVNIKIALHVAKNVK